MRVIGIDPAPGRGLFVFDGDGDQVIPLSDARDYLNNLANLPDVLVSWDAPLTGPPDEVLRGASAQGSAFTKRPVERFFSISRTGYKVPKGISVLGYAGCPHWSISRSLIGLPRTGPYDRPEDSLPFRLKTDDRPPKEGTWIVEVHPALAMWLWCREEGLQVTSWEYKKSRAILRILAERLTETVFATIPELLNAEPAANDDQLDARIAFALGTLWLRNDDSRPILLLGDLGLGTFLVPDTPGLRKSFQQFLVDERLA